MSSKAELRRLMKLHRAKLEHEAVSSQQESHLMQDIGEDELAATTTTTTQRNQPVKGILKASSIVKPAASVGVSTLLAGYASSSDSEPDEVETEQLTEVTKQSSKPLEPSASEPLSPSFGEGSERAKVRFHATVVDAKEKLPTSNVRDESSFKPPKSLLSLPKANSFDPQSTIASSTTATTTATQSNLDSAWQEFEALLTDDNGEPSEKASSVNDGASTALPDTTDVGASSGVSESPSDDDVSAYAQVEQASYEARLARLRNKIKKRTLPSAQPPKDELPLLSSNTESSNLLAFVDESSDNNLSLLPSAPLGQILRKKRARARALVGWDEETGREETKK